MSAEGDIPIWIQVGGGIGAAVAAVYVGIKSYMKKPAEERVKLESHELDSVSGSMLRIATALERIASALEMSNMLHLNDGRQSPPPHRQPRSRRID